MITGTGCGLVLGEEGGDGVLAELGFVLDRLAHFAGSLAEIRKTTIAYKTFFAKSSIAAPDNYSVDHTGFIYLVGKDGRYLGFLPPGLAPDAIADAIRTRLGPE